jgi:hypothetical protein
LREAAIDHRHDLRRAVRTERLLKAKAKLGDFVRGHPRLFDANLSVQFPYGQTSRARYPDNYLISLARPTGLEPVFSP